MLESVVVLLTTYSTKLTQIVINNNRLIMIKITTDRVIRIDNVFEVCVNSEMYSKEKQSKKVVFLVINIH